MNQADASRASTAPAGQDGQDAPSGAFENTPSFVDGAFVGEGIATMPSPLEGDTEAVEDDAGAGLAGFGVDGVDTGQAI